MSAKTPDQFHRGVYSCTSGVPRVHGLQDGFVLPLFREYGPNDDQSFQQSIDLKGLIECFVQQDIDRENDTVEDVAGPTFVRPGDAAIYGFLSCRHGGMCGNYYFIRDFVMDIREDYVPGNPFLLYNIMEFAQDDEGLKYASAELQKSFGSTISAERLQNDYPGGLATLAETRTSQRAKKEQVGLTD